ncbi:MAG: hypothetical protein AAF965_00885 [Pseudomonadota bacterium]
MRVPTRETRKTLSRFFSLCCLLTLGSATLATEDVLETKVIQICHHGRFFEIPADPVPFIDGKYVVTNERDKNERVTFWHSGMPPLVTNRVDIRNANNGREYRGRKQRPIFDEILGEASKYHVWSLRLSAPTYDDFWNLNLQDVQDSVFDGFWRLSRHHTKNPANAGFMLKDYEMNGYPVLVSCSGEGLPAWSKDRSSQTCSVRSVGPTGILSVVRVATGTDLEGPWPRLADDREAWIDALKVLERAFNRISEVDRNQGALCD